MSLIEFFQLRNIRKQQEQTNELLEQIRRLQLTPEQRAQEDQDEAEDIAADIRGYWVLLAVGVLVAIVTLYMGAMAHWKSNAYFPMREQLVKFLTARPFKPFTVELDNDAAYSIATADHASMSERFLSSSMTTGRLPSSPLNTSRDCV
jgi:hypothetical protein